MSKIERRNEFIDRAIGLGIIVGAPLIVLGGVLIFRPERSQGTLEPISANSVKGLSPTPESTRSIQEPTVTPIPRITVEEILQSTPNIIAEYKSQVGNLSDQEVFGSLRLYVEDGARVRRRNLFTQVMGLREGSLLEVQSYNFWKEFLGFETSEKGRTQNVDEYKVGDVVTVEDWSSPPGIFLRRMPCYPIDQAIDPFTFNGDNLYIAEGPQLCIDEKNKEVWEMYKVDQVHLRGGSWFYRGYHEGGWIWRGWFGGKHHIQP
ncbi:hypothetical protein HYS94_01070 [Candidatus Daviesbacteria bacterium]|nr:hypothetical protein [Candidatus Daviesbacteria bacterium]